MRRVILSFFIVFNVYFSVDMSFAQDSPNKDVATGISAALKDEGTPSATQESKGESNPDKNLEENESERRKKATCWFFIVQTLFLLCVFFGYPFFCWIKGCCDSKKGKSLPLMKGLALPEGSVRAMIAIAIIGSYLITLSMGSMAIASDIFDKIIAAFGGLVGAVVGFYFASRGNDQKDSNNDSST